MERTVRSIMDGLPVKQKAAFMQRKVEGLDYESIATSLRCSPDAARAHVFQALKKIREGLESVPTGRRTNRRGPPMRV